MAPRARVVIRPPGPRDMRAFVAAARRSRELHHPWVTVPDSPAKFRVHLQRMSLPVNYGFLVCRTDTRALVGVIDLTNVVRGVFCSGYLGYYAFAGHERQGLMREGLALVVRHAFRELKLHRSGGFTSSDRFPLELSGCLSRTG